GCYAQLKPEEIANIHGVDLVLGAAEKFNITQHLKELTKSNVAKICSCDIEEVTAFNSSWSINDRTRTFLKVQDGCNYNCSFCTIPMARGKSRCDSINNIIAHATQLAKAGVKEIVLTGINLGDYLTPTFPLTPALSTSGEGEGRNFYSLIQALEKLDGIERFRISSIEPNLLTNDIIEFVANSNKFMPHFHIPLQSGSNKILGLMRRRYKKEVYIERVNLIKKLMPHCAIGVDVIVGFPGETETDFQETYDLLHSLDVSYLHVFTYSERENTAALHIAPVVPIKVRHERNKALRNLSYKKLNHFKEQHTGEIRKVLFEAQSRNGLMEGYTDNYIKITAFFKPELVNQIVDWKV
ncbi:MAG: MiaB/RimO family radical SAM methylthiotransferase, partial [Chitinophagaceae bacterium]|nr:MiaB/RimO family radical SAM methylthiotransferase [Chitinophagaceae bacterium]